MERRDVRVAGGGGVVLGHGADDKLKKKNFVREATVPVALSRRPYPLPRPRRAGEAPALPDVSKCSRRS